MDRGELWLWHSSQKSLQRGLIFFQMASNKCYDIPKTEHHIVYPSNSRSFIFIWHPSRESQSIMQKFGQHDGQQCCLTARVRAGVRVHGSNPGWSGAFVLSLHVLPPVCLGFIQAFRVPSNVIHMFGNCYNPLSSELCKNMGEV